MPIRYMGTKRSIADHVKRLIADLSPKGQVLDLFSGIGCVAESLANVAPIYTNDLLSFTALFARARFKGPRQYAPQQLIEEIRPLYRQAVEDEIRSKRSRLRDEQRAIDLGYEALGNYMLEAQHVANSRIARRHATRAARLDGAAHYRLVSQYFSAGYFSLRQSIHLDALRYAIDHLDLHDGDRDWALAAWLSTAGKVVNAPGHTAQYLKPNTEESYKRIRRSWVRNIWETFQNELIDMRLVGTEVWRQQNNVRVGDALQLLRSNKIPKVGAIYADPPYTKDQYSRYYHVYETMYLYDYPISEGQGRVRGSRFVSNFCLMTQVADSFTDLFSSAASLGLPLVLSYPSEGLLSKSGHSVATIGEQHMRLKKVESLGASHSTLGASKGLTTKNATENIYVYIPK
jgi:adenine-specific DNA-methyltransferase